MLPLFSVGLFAFCSEENNAIEQSDEGKDNKPIVQNGKILVAYFSRANYVPEGTDGVSGATNKVGNTQTIAYYIANKLEGTIFEIVPECNYPISHSECSAIAQQEVKDNMRPELKSHVENMEEYSTIFVGFPIWVYREPMAVLTFFRRI